MFLYVNENKSPDKNNFSKTPHNNISFNTYDNNTADTNTDTDTADDTGPIFPFTSQTPSKARERSTSINPIPDFTIAFASPDGESSNIVTIYEKIKIQSFKDNILQNLRENITEIFDPEFVNFKALC